ncbi:MAG: hypothetical protein V1863_03565 [Candidatus Omnitrophota bacterium]
MRTSRSILYTALGTVFSLMYVFEQTEIVKMGYRITLAQKVLEQYLDRHTSLTYTVSSLESPLNLDKGLLSDKDGFEMPRAYRLVKLEPSQNAPTQSPQSAAPKGFGAGLKRLALLSLFADKQVEAKPVK